MLFSHSELTGNKEPLNSLKTTVTYLKGVAKKPGVLNL